jgi:hypothetical protein
MHPLCPHPESSGARIARRDCRRVFGAVFFSWASGFDAFASGGGAETWAFLLPGYPRALVGAGRFMLLALFASVMFSLSFFALDPFQFSVIFPR